MGGPASVAVAENAERDQKVAVSPEEEKVKAVSCCKFFKFATFVDYCLMLLGAIGGAATGIAMPAFSIVLGNMYTDFQAPGADVIAAGNKYASLFGYIGVGTFFAAAFQVGCFTLTAERQIIQIRKEYLNSILKQDISWFDTCNSGSLGSKVAENTVLIREGIVKLGQLFQFSSMFLTGFVVGFVKNWNLTLIILAGAPLLAGGGAMMMKFMADSTSGALDAYSKAGATAEESFSMIRTLTSLGLENTMIKKYTDSLKEAESCGIRKARGAGLGMGFTFGVYFLMYALAFWYGAILVTDSKEEAAVQFPPSAAIDPRCVLGTVVTPEMAADLMCSLNGYTQNYTFTIAADICNCFRCHCGCTVSTECVNGGDIVLVFFAVVMASFSLGQASPSISALMNGKAAAGKVYSIIDRIPTFSEDQNGGEKPDKIDGRIEFRDVQFHYPSRPDSKIFKKLNLTIEAGQTVALVGGSGCGKSTATQLLQRFYDPVGGSVLLDNKNITDLNLVWLRDNIGVVGQEPVLFATTIEENIKYGAKKDQTPGLSQVEQAAKSANAYDFIQTFPEKFQTFVGEKGGALSGGQKQRISIARAIIRDPSILILDEATSALDNTSEKVVQKALDDLLKQKKRTTLVIAHRLSTVRNADKIVVLGEGGVLEQGTHEELLALEGHYSALVSASQRSQEGEEDVDLRPASAGSRPGSRHSSGRRGDEHDAPGKADSSEVTKEEKKEEKEKLYSVSFGRLYSTYSSEEFWHYVPGTLASMINGAVMPLFAILFAGISNVYFFPTLELMTEEANKYSLYFIALSSAVAAGQFLAQYHFGYIGEKCTTRVRKDLFKCILRQDVGFFDDRKNNVGALTTALSTHAAHVKAALGDKIGLIIANLTTFAVGLAIAFSYGWQLTLALIGLLPILVIGGFLEMQAMKGFSSEDDDSMESASQVLQESISGVRTVTSFGLRPKIIQLYDKLLEAPSKLALKKGVTGGLAYGFSQASMFSIYAIAFYYGSRLIADDDYTFQQMINVFFAVVMMGFGAGQAAAMSPDVAHASIGISKTFQIIDRKSKVDPFDTEGSKDEAQTSTEIVMSNLEFAYPSRPDSKLFNGFSLTIQKGQTVALVGQSGSGKSTCINFLERFYDPDAGTVTFNGVDVRNANIGWLRRKIGFVQQEPQLFDTTIFENIAYGVAQGSDQSVPVTQEQVEAAAKAANAHDFISKFPDGYQTGCGRGGKQLSGGQKQRICLARCLIRDPEVLLLDEATSALDNESERIVQDALDKMMTASSRTTIVIAHRLTTIQNADVICVVDHGKIVEKGTHAELMHNKKGIYYQMYTAQDKHQE